MNQRTADHALHLASEDSFGVCMVKPHKGLDGVLKGSALLSLPNTVPKVARLGLGSSLGNWPSPLMTVPFISGTYGNPKGLIQSHILERKGPELIVIVVSKADDAMIEPGCMIRPDIAAFFKCEHAQPSIPVCGCTKVQKPVAGTGFRVGRYMVI